MERNLYLNKLIRKKNNGLIKVITGIRRSGKTYLLFELFYDYLIKSGVDKDHIIKIALDDRINKKYRDPDILCEYVHDVVKDDQIYYVLLDEVQMVSEFEDVLNSFLHMKNFYQRILLRNFEEGEIKCICFLCLLQNICQEKVLIDSRHGRNIQCMVVYLKCLKLKMKKTKQYI